MASRKVKLTTPHYSTRLEVGAWNNLPHYAVIGDQCSFYLWKNEDGRGDNTKCITGREATKIINKLRELRVKSKAAFIEAFVQYYTEYQK